MRITFLSPHVNISGGTRAILKYSDLLTRRGHDVQVVVPAARLSRRIYHRIRIRFFGEPRWQPTATRIRFVPSLDQQFLPTSDATVATAWRTAAALGRADERAGARLCLVQAYEGPHIDKPEEVDPTYQPGFRTIAVSHWLSQHLRNNFGVEAETIVVPIDHDVVFPGRVKRNNKLRICMMHHNRPWKDIDTALAGPAGLQASLGRIRSCPVDHSAEEGFLSRGRITRV